MPEHLQPFTPLICLIALAAWGGYLKRKSNFKPPSDPLWPFAQNPGLALELADSPEFVTAILGSAATPEGLSNRVTAIRVQRLDFVLIPLYVLFFGAAALTVGSLSTALAAIVLALLTACADVGEDLRIISMTKGDGSAPPRRLGQIKWFFYFATLAAQGQLLFMSLANRPIVGMVLGVGLVAIAAGGVISAVKGSFTGILSAVKISMLGLAALALAPMIDAAPFAWNDAIMYLFLLRVPLLIGLALFSLPFIAFLTGAKTLLRGLFDLTPPSLFVVTLTTIAVAGTVSMTAYLVLAHAHARFGAYPIPLESLPSVPQWLLLVAILSLPIVACSVLFSAKQKRGLGGLTAAALSAAIVGLALAYGVTEWGVAVGGYLSYTRFESWLAATGLFAGYFDPASPTPWKDQRLAVTAFATVAVLYVSVGIYGWSRLGKSRTVPALASALMILLMLGWMVAGVAFFFDAWRIPVLLILALYGLLTAQSVRSDHFYHLRERPTKTAAPSPGVVITASQSRRVIVVAANGGGIQAGAWAAQVLHGLFEDCGDPFRKSLRMISSVSGGSVGSACFVNWLANPDSAGKPPVAAAKSSLDEVSWGLAWTDFLRSLVPWLLGSLMGRGRALEKAWCMNSAAGPDGQGKLDEALSGWNPRVASGELPAMVMNATIAESGERLLLATTQLGQNEVQGRARVDATGLHTINGDSWDVSVVTGARLSASFPYVTPASRSDGPGPQPHIVDGGYYDNFGMATMVEWLDEALTTSSKVIESVLVLQVHGSPVQTDLRDARHEKSHGWFYQAIAPLTTLAAVRGAGQIAHNDIELALVQQKWDEAGIPVHSIQFEFHGPNAPLSWHLTPTDIADIQTAWSTEMSDCRKLVRQFLAGNDQLGCGCPRCAQLARSTSA